MLSLKYAEDQPCVPAGSPEGGQWASGGGGLADFVDELGDAAAQLPSLLLAGGFGKEDMGKTVQEFVAEYRAGCFSVPARRQPRRRARPTGK